MRTLKRRPPCLLETISHSRGYLLVKHGYDTFCPHVLLYSTLHTLKVPKPETPSMAEQHALHQYGKLKRHTSTRSLSLLPEPRERDTSAYETFGHA